MIVNTITDLIGNTPLLQISEEVHGLKNVQLYAKLEYLNPFGSVKDRIAWGIIKDDIMQINENHQMIIESSSGNTAKALQGIASIYKTHLKTVTNRIKIPEQKMVLQILGAEIEELPGKSQCPDPSDPNDPLAMIERELIQHPNKYYHTSQYTNKKNILAHYETTGKEIVHDLQHVDYFFGGLGTAGSTTGTAMAIKEASPDLKTVGVVATPDDVIPGIRTMSEMWEVGLYNKDFYEDITPISSVDAVDGMITLIRKCGIYAGPTSGAAYLATVKYLQSKTFDTPINVVFIACDRFEWYLSYIKERRPNLFQEVIKKDSIKELKSEMYINAPERTVEEAQSWIQEYHPLIIDIRGNIAFQSAHIENAINIPEEAFEIMVDRNKPFSKDQSILIVCPTGERSKKFAYYLHEKGYMAFSMTGGIIHWRDQGFPLITQFKL
jgi:S-sulfo-L-cysteine synthase (O-acetyl-L-serine-dependent)